MRNSNRNEMENIIGLFFFFLKNMFRHSICFMQCFVCLLHFFAPAVGRPSWWQMDMQTVLFLYIFRSCIRKRATTCQPFHFDGVIRPEPNRAHRVLADAERPCYARWHFGLNVFVNSTQTQRYMGCCIVIVDHVEWRMNELSTLGCASIAQMCTAFLFLFDVKFYCCAIWIDVEKWHLVLQLK